MYTLEPLESQEPCHGRTCPKCGHERQPHDEAPNWQCPNCGVAYEKVEAPIPTASASTARTELNRRPAAPVLWILGAVIAVLAFAAYEWSGSATATRVEAPNGAQVVMFATPTCSYCAQARAFFARHDVGYYEYDVTASQEASDKFQDLGGRGVPLILVDSHRIDGYEEQTLRAKLRSAGLM